MELNLHIFCNQPHGEKSAHVYHKIVQNSGSFKKKYKAIFFSFFFPGKVAIFIKLIESSTTRVENLRIESTKTERVSCPLTNILIQNITGSWDQTQIIWEKLEEKVWSSSRLCSPPLEEATWQKINSLHFLTVVARVKWIFGVSVPWMLSFSVVVHTWSHKIIPKAENSLLWFKMSIGLFSNQPTNSFTSLLGSSSLIPMERQTKLFGWMGNPRKMVKTPVTILKA